MAECQSVRYASRKPCDPDGARFVVEYRSTVDNSLTDSHPACFTHGLAEVDRHYASAGIAKCELTGPTDPTYVGGHTMKYCPYPDCSFSGTDEEVDDHRIAGHRDEPQEGSNLTSRPGRRVRHIGRAEDAWPDPADRVRARVAAEEEK